MSDNQTSRITFSLRQATFLDRLLARAVAPLSRVGALLMAAASIASVQPSAVSAQDRLERLGPKRDLSVLWVGHSLVEAKAKSEWGENSLMSLVGRFAEARGLAYRMGDHTLWGSALSALWRGHPHNYKRDASVMVAKREAFQRSASQYDTLVATEGLPVSRSLTHEFSAYYLRQFYCTLKQANPAARVYLYQSWLNFHGSDPHSKFPPAHKFDWRAEMVAQRKSWEELAEAASQTKVRAPARFRWLDRIGWSPTSNAGCDSQDPIFIVPVGQAMIALSDRLSASPVAGDGFAWPDGTRLRMGDLFSNTYIDWPADWPVTTETSPLDPASRLATLKLRDHSRPLDDIHPSALGIYFVALVHFATLYRQSPVDLPAPPSIGKELATALQCVAWTAVVNEPRSGVAGDPSC